MQYRFAVNFGTLSRFHLKVARWIFPCRFETDDNEKKLRSLGKEFTLIRKIFFIITLLQRLYISNIIQYSTFDIFCNIYKVENDAIIH